MIAGIPCVEASRGGRTRTCNPRFWRPPEGGPCGRLRLSQAVQGHARSAEVTSLGQRFGQQPRTIRSWPRRRYRRRASRSGRDTPPDWWHHTIAISWVRGAGSVGNASPRAYPGAYLEIVEDGRSRTASTVAHSWVGRLPFGGRLDTATFGRPQQPFRGFGHDPEPTIPVPDGSAAVMGRSSTRPSPVRARAAIAVNGVQLTARPPRATCPIRGNLRCAAQVSTLSSIYRGRASECWAPACGGGKGRTPFRGSVQLADWPKHPFRAAPWSCGSIVVRVGGGGVTGGRG
jgi:hypothetical protein